MVIGTKKDFTLEGPPGKITMTMITGLPRGNQISGNDFIINVKAYGVLHITEQ